MPASLVLLPEAVLSSPAVAGGLLYVGSYDHDLYAFDASCRTPANLSGAFPERYIYSSPAVAGGIVYVSSYDHNLYAFDATVATPASLS